jgi:uncharacterized integral membrane protein
MNFLKQLAVTFVVCCVLQYFLPWWSLAAGSFAAGYAFNSKGFVSFLAGFLGVSLLWLTVAWVIDLKTASILSDKVDKILPINVYLLTALVGGLTGGFAALTGSSFKSIS